MKYGRKSYKRTHRAFKKSHRRFVSSRRKFIRSNLRFGRKLNQVAEKKMVSGQLVAAGLTAANAGAAPTMNTLASCIPGQGAGPNQRVGSKIFIRYLILNMVVTPNVGGFWTQGLISMIYMKAKKNFRGNYPTVANITQTNFDAGLDYEYLKDTFSKLSRKDYLVQSGASMAATGEITGDLKAKIYILKKKRIRIMKECTIDANGAINLPDFQYLWVYWAPPYTNNAANGPDAIAISYTMTFTDV